MTAYIDASLPKLNVTREEFWQVATDAAQQALVRRRTRARERVEELVSSARSRYVDGIGSPENQDRESVVAQLLEGVRPATDDSVTVECPGWVTELLLGVEFDWTSAEMVMDGTRPHRVHR